MDRLIEFYRKSSNTGKVTQWMFLSLYMLLLGIFIMLFSISTLEESRLKATSDSLKSALNVAAAMGISRIENDRDEIAGAKLIARLNDILKKDFSLSKLTTSQSGLTLYVSFRGDDLFVAGSAAVLQPRLSVLKRLAALMKSRSDEWRYETVIVVPLDYASRGLMPEVETLSVQRSAELMRVLASSGMPLTQIKAGVQKTGNNDISVIFRAVPFSNVTDMGYKKNVK